MVNELKFWCLIIFGMLNFYWGLDYKLMRMSMISLIFNYRYFGNMVKEVRKVVVFIMFYMCVLFFVVLFVF